MLSDAGDEMGRQPWGRPSAIERCVEGGGYKPANGGLDTTPKTYRPRGCIMPRTLPRAATVIVGETVMGHAVFVGGVVDAIL